jgi:uncharacterized protein (TIGR03437 family)
MHHSIKMNPARTRQWSRAAIAGLAGIVSLWLPALCQAQTPPTYTITTIAGMGPPAIGGYAGDSLAAISAQLNGPTSVAFDASGNMYIADQFNNAIRQVSKGIIATLVYSTPTGYSGDAGPAISAGINYPDTIAVDSQGNYYFSDVNNGAIRMVNAKGVISTFAGSQTLGVGFAGDGALAIDAELNKPAGIAFDSAGNLYIADSGNFRIRKVTLATLDITTIAGSGTEGFSNEGGAALSAHLDGTRQIAVAKNGDIYLADSNNNQIRKVSGGIISTVAGSATALFGYTGDGGLATNALLDHPTGIAVDSAGDVYICDTFNNVIRMVTPDGIIHTIAGTGSLITPLYSGDGGPALSAQFDEPTSITIDASGNLYICDLANNVIRMMTPSAAPGGPGPAPAIRTTGNPGVQSASDFGALPSIAPGSWIEIYGTNLASATRPWATTDFTGIDAPTSLNLTTVSVGGQSAFVEYISPGQINAQVPGTIGLGSQAVIVSTPAGASAAYNITATLQQPGLYAPAVFRIVGKQYVGALFTDGLTYVFPTGSFAGITSRPAMPGETIVMYGIGFGPVPGNPPGQIPQAANGLTLPLAPKFYFGGVLAQVQYAGLVEGAIGEYQFNVIVPNVSCGTTCSAVPLTFTVNENGTDVPGAQTLYTAILN